MGHGGNPLRAGLDPPNAGKLSFGTLSMRWLAHAISAQPWHGSGIVQIVSSCREHWPSSPGTYPPQKKGPFWGPESAVGIGDLTAYPTGAVGAFNSAVRTNCGMSVLDRSLCRPEMISTSDCRRTPVWARFAQWRHHRILRHLRNGEYFRRVSLHQHKSVNKVGVTRRGSVLMLMLLAFSLIPGAFFAGYFVGNLREQGRRPEFRWPAEEPRPRTDRSRRSSR